MLALLAAGAAVRAPDDGASWFHLAAGRSIARHGLPAQESWSLTGRGQPADLSSWAWDLGLFQAWSLAGPPAVAGVRALIAGATVLALAALLGAAGASWLPAALLLPLLLVVAQADARAGPWSLLPLFLLLGLALVERSRRGADRTRWLIPAQVAWANLHPSWALGPVAIWTMAAFAALHAFLRRRRGAAAPDDGGADPRPPAARWAVLALVLWAAAAVTPRPLDTLAHPFILFEPVAPWPSQLDSFRAWNWGADRLAPFTAWLAVVAVAALLGGRHAWRTSPAMVVLGSAALMLSLFDARFRGLAAWISCAPVAIALTPNRSWLGRARWIPALGAAALGLVVLAQGAGRPVSAPPMPERAAALAESTGVTGVVLNVPEHGGYLLWVRGDSNPPLVDARARTSQEFRRMYLMAGNDPIALDSLQEAWDFTHAVLPPPSGEQDRLTVNLARRLEWALVFTDDDGLLFVRWSRQPALAAARAYRYYSPDLLGMLDLADRARADSGLARRLEGELLRARAESPRHANASFWLGRLAIMRGDGPAAVSHFEEAQRIRPRLPGLALQQGMAYEQIGDREKARAAYERARDDPEDAEVAEIMRQGAR